MSLSRNRKPDLSADAGFSLVTVLVAIGIAGILAVAVSKIMGIGFKGNRSIQNRTDLGHIRNLISTRLDCVRTLGAAPAICDGTAIVMRDSGNRPLATGNRIGDWTIGASCPSTCDANENNPGTGATPCNQIVVVATWPGIDPLTGRPRNLTATNSRGATVSTDLFGGMAVHCPLSYQGRFSDEVVQPATYRFPAAEFNADNSTLGNWYAIPGLQVTLPTAGKYQITVTGTATMFLQGGDGTSGGGLLGRLYNTTTGTVVPDTLQALVATTLYNNLLYGQFHVAKVLQVGQQTTVRFEAALEPTGAGFVRAGSRILSHEPPNPNYAAATVMSYIRLPN